MKNVLTYLACLISVSVYGQGACDNQSSVTHQGYEYDIVEIGYQCWFSENCRYLPSVSLSSDSSTTDPYFYVYGYEGTNVEEAKSTDNYLTYGVLYNWSAVMTEGVCPSGWHIPSDEEFMEVIDYIGTGSGSVKVLKSTTGWNTSYNDTNSSGFNGLPGGCANSVFYGIGHSACWWSSSASGSYNAWIRGVHFNYPDRLRSWAHRYNGLSARCIRD